MNYLYRSVKYLIIWKKRQKNIGYVLSAQNNDMFRAEIYCFVSKDFSGKSISLKVGNRAIKEKIVKNIPIKRYDLTKKEQWQKLTI